jgi:hypothetical protein
MGRFARWTTALGAACALLVTGCSGGSSGDGGSGGNADGARPSADSSGSTAQLPSSLTSQKLDWGRCKAAAGFSAPGGDWQCATLKVPLDWSKPGGETIGLALIRAQARGDNRIGSLLFNFGGPGSSGVATMPAYAAVVPLLRAGPS